MDKEITRTCRVYTLLLLEKAMQSYISFLLHILFPLPESPCLAAVLFTLQELAKCHFLCDDFLFFSLIPLSQLKVFSLLGAPLALCTLLCYSMYCIILYLLLPLSACSHGLWAPQGPGWCLNGVFGAMLSTMPSLEQVFIFKSCLGWEQILLPFFIPCGFLAKSDLRNSSPVGNEIWACVILHNDLQEL